VPIYLPLHRASTDWLVIALGGGGSDQPMDTWRAGFHLYTGAYLQPCISLKQMKTWPFYNLNRAFLFGFFFFFWGGGDGFPRASRITIVAMALRFNAVLLKQQCVQGALLICV